MHGASFVPNSDASSSEGSVVINRSAIAQEPVAFPVEALDAILALPGRGYDLEKALMFRRVTRHTKSAEWVTVESLIGQDLKGTTVWYYFANWEDSEWISIHDGVFSVDADDPSRGVWEADEFDSHADLLIDIRDQVLLVRH